MFNFQNVKIEDKGTILSTDTYWELEAISAFAEIKKIERNLENESIKLIQSELIKPVKGNPPGKFHASLDGHGEGIAREKNKNDEAQNW